MISKNIIVNASALRSSGGLIILQQFVGAIPADETLYIIFVDKSVNLKIKNKNIQIIPLIARSFLKRFILDIYGINSWMKKNNVIPFATISLQNTNFRTSEKCPNYIYFHQPMPLYSYRWSLLSSNERKLWFYKHIYPFFVKLFINSRTEVFVQLEFIKNEFCSAFNFNKEKVHVVFPNLETPLPKHTLDFRIDSNKLNLFYPAVSFIYKNHDVLFKALFEIDNKLSKQIVLYLTNSINEFKELPKYNNIEIIFLGKIAQEEVVWMYNNVDALVFPSYIETLGLPLIEAASFGLPIIAANLPYAKEVLNNYSGVEFIDIQSEKNWGEAIIKLTLSEKKKIELYKKENHNTWAYLFKTINHKLYAKK